MHHTPQAYTKTPNPSPIDLRKKAQDLMNAAENTPPTIIALGPLSDAAMAVKIMESPAPDITPEGIKIGTITLDVLSVPNDARRVASQIEDQLDALGMLDGESAGESPRPLGEAGQETYLAVKLPNLPEGTTVMPQDFTVERGLASVLVQRHGDSLTDEPMTWWAIRPITHEGFNSDNAGQTVPFLDTLHRQRFETIEQAVAYAVKWLDALDAWFAAIEAATAGVAETVGA